MRLFALSDLHLSFSGKKPMDVFGECWKDHPRRVEAAWREVVGENDVVLLPGDFSWALRLDEAKPELDWLGTLPGRKILLKGNHDYWWASPGKVRAALPPGVFALQNDSLTLDGVAFGGARGWVDPRLDFSGLCVSEKTEGEPFYPIQGEEDDRKLYERELQRLDMSLAKLDPMAKLRVAMLHFPPTSPILEATEVTELLEKHRVDLAVFGHLHLTGPTSFQNPWGVRNGITYYLTSSDFLAFRPLCVAEVPAG